MDCREIGSLKLRLEDGRLIVDQDGRPMVPVHVCWSDSEGDIVVSVLKVYGIEALVNSEVPHSVMPFTANGLGKVTVLVSEAMADEARRILAAYEEDMAENMVEEDAENSVENNVEDNAVNNAEDSVEDGAEDGVHEGDVQEGGVGPVEPSAEG